MKVKKTILRMGHGLGMLLLMGACTAAQISTFTPEGDKGGVSDEGSGDTSPDTGDTRVDSGDKARVSPVDLFETEITYLTCESTNFENERCSLDRALKGRVLSVTVDTQYSYNKCVEGKSFKRHNRGVVVMKDCRAQFAVTRVTNLMNRRSHTNNGWRHHNVTAIASGEIALNLEDGDTVDLSSLEEGVLSEHGNGIGVQGGAPVPHQINHSSPNEESEAILIELPDNSFEVQLQVSRLFKNEGSGERLKVYLLNEDGEVIHVAGMSDVRYKRGSEHEASMRLKAKSVAKHLILLAEKMETAKNENDSSDYLLTSVKTTSVVVTD